MGRGVSGLCGSEEEACKPSICTEGLSEGKNSMCPPAPSLLTGSYGGGFFSSSFSWDGAMWSCWTNAWTWGKMGC